ncbi:UNVERIFIED_CONTAM: hypothetical protein FKN15_017878 [Acipenser sinensis]
MSISTSWLLEQSAVRWPLYHTVSADDPVLLPPAKQGLQQSLALLELYCRRPGPWHETRSRPRLRENTAQEKAG